MKLALGRSFFRLAEIMISYFFDKSFDLHDNDRKIIWLLLYKKNIIRKICVIAPASEKNDRVGSLDLALQNFPGSDQEGIGVIADRNRLMGTIPDAGSLHKFFNRLMSFAYVKFHKVRGYLS